MTLDSLIIKRKKDIFNLLKVLLKENTQFDYGLIHFAISDLESRFNKCKNALKRNLTSILDASKKEELLGNIDNFVKYEFYQALDDIYLKISSENLIGSMSDYEIDLFAIKYYQQIIHVGENYEELTLKRLQSNNPNKNYHPKSN